MLGWIYRIKLVISFQHVLSAKAYYIVARHPRVVSVVNHSKVLFQLHCIIKLFNSSVCLCARVQWAQCIHMQASGGVVARQPVNLAVATCDSCREMSSNLVPWSITIRSMGPSAARGVKITGDCRQTPLRAEVGRWRLVALSSLSHSAARWQLFWLVL